MAVQRGDQNAATPAAMRLMLTASPVGLSVATATCAVSSPGERLAKTNLRLSGDHGVIAREYWSK
jgi:hypothetical protein